MTSEDSTVQDLGTEGLTHYKDTTRGQYRLAGGEDGYVRVQDELLVHNVRIEYSLEPFHFLNVIKVVVLLIIKTARRSNQA
ncbi:hypothetical protein RRG08_037472 [Elysia crispata]|uniref:Uncharacterized protein n=1 Tax=Elysia crispata TaxID=231223 RepID=A0AAE1B1C7_9GAST|nr:hypothetical protein RRG08_037472 [Elysia crispata]